MQGQQFVWKKKAEGMCGVRLQETVYMIIRDNWKV